MSNSTRHTFETPEQLHTWLQLNHACSATTVKSEDFLAALQQDPVAQAFYATLKRQSLFAVHCRLHSAKRPETRQKRMVEMLAKLVRGESP